MAFSTVNNYKQFHKPLKESVSKTKQGYYVPQNPEKVIGGNIIYRSSWEEKFCRWCDLNKNVLRWGVEVIQIPYKNPAAVNLNECKKNHLNAENSALWPVNNYWPDFYIEIQNADGKVSKILIEIKPKCQTQRPISPGDAAKLNEQKRFVNSAQTYIRNKAKWDAAINFCKQKGDLTFQIFTEDTLEKLGLM